MKNFFPFDPRRQNPQSKKWIIENNTKESNKINQIKSKDVWRSQTNMERIYPTDLQNYVQEETKKVEETLEDVMLPRGMFYGTSLWKKPYHLEVQNVLLKPRSKKGGINFFKTYWGVNQLIMIIKMIFTIKW